MTCSGRIADAALGVEPIAVAGLTPFDALGAVEGTIPSDARVIPVHCKRGTGRFCGVPMTPKEIDQAVKPSHVESAPPGPPAGSSPLATVAPPRDERLPETPMPFSEEVDYPSYDGIPMADNTDQAEAIVDAFHAVRAYFWEREDVFVAVNLLLYYREGDNKTRITPDVMVAVGRPKGFRGSYKIWEEGHHPPDWVLEVASEESVEVDVEEKPGTYAEIGVREYWQYDPSGGLLDPRLQGRHLTELGYTELPQVQVAGAEIAIYSEVLGLRLEFDGEQLRFWDPAGGRYFLTILDIGRGRLKAERRAEEAQGRREALRRAAGAERGRREEAQGRREAECRARAAERRVQELEAQIASLRAGTQPPGGPED